jgi:hypothetical protein
LSSLSHRPTSTILNLGKFGLFLLQLSRKRHFSGSIDFMTLLFEAVCLYLKKATLLYYYGDLILHI